MTKLIKTYALMLLAFETPANEAVRQGVAETLYRVERVRTARLALEAAGATAAQVDAIRESPVDAYSRAATFAFFN